MALRTNRESVKDWESTCFVCITEDDLDEGETLEGLVNPPVEEKVNDDGSTTRFISMNPTPWFYEKEDKTRIWKLNSVTFSLEQGSMLIGLGEITESNWEEFWTRLNLCEKAIGCFTSDGTDNKRFITPDEVKAHIGLRANVVPISRSKFNHKVVRWLREDAKRMLQKIEEVEKS
jgi:hypothetical protein